MSLNSVEAVEVKNLPSEYQPKPDPISDLN